jgi:hypothetical protein
MNSEYESGYKIGTATLVGSDGKANANTSLNQRGKSKECGTPRKF